MWVENCSNFIVGRTKRTKIVDRETERVVLLEYENLFRWIKKEKNLKCGGDRERERRTEINYKEGKNYQINRL